MKSLEQFEQNNALFALLRLEAEASFLFARIRERRSEIDSLQLCQRKDESRIDDLIDQIHIQTDDARKSNDDPTLSMYDWHSAALPGTDVKS